MQVERVPAHAAYERLDSLVSHVRNTVRRRPASRGGYYQGAGDKEVLALR